MPQYDIVIKGGTVIDGRRTPRYRADVGIRDGRSSDRRIDATEGAEVARRDRQDRRARLHRPPHALRQPGLLGPVVHPRRVARRHERGHRQLRVRVRAVPPEDRERAMLSLTRNEAIPLETMREGMPWDWVTFPEYLDSVDRTPKGVNVMSFVPLRRSTHTWWASTRRRSAGHRRRSCETDVRAAGRGDGRRWLR